MLNCVVCGGKNPKFSLPLTKKDGEWVLNPVCGGCKAGLMAEAHAEGRSIRIFSLAGSEIEAAKRNGNVLKFRPFLDAFAKANVSVDTYRKDGDKREQLAKA